MTNTRVKEKLKMDKFTIIGERIHCISPVIKQAMADRDPEPIIKRAKEQLAAGATYLDVNIGPAEKDGEELMQWAVKLIQESCDNVPLALDTANKKAIVAGIQVYNRSKGKPIINSADAGDRISYIDLAAENDAIAIALCSKQGVPRDNDERMQYCQEMLEYGMERGMEAEDLWFDPLTLVIKGMQEKQVEFLEFIGQLSDMGLNSTAGLSNASNGMPKEVRPVVDGVVTALAMGRGLTSAILNPCDKELMKTIKTVDIIFDRSLYADSYLDF
jgi:5-methyltetrahydrofolate corrinoid/iron sulfur protein methyltransferase